MPINSEGRIGPVTNRKTEWKLAALNDRDIVLTCATFDGMVFKRHIQPDIRPVFINIKG